MFNPEATAERQSNVIKEKDLPDSPAEEGEYIMLIFNIRG